MGKGAELAYSAEATWLPASTRPTLGRRLVTIPTTLVATLVGSVVAPVLLPAAIVVDVLALGRLSATRTALFFLAFLWAETVGLMLAVWLWVRHRESREFLRANAAMQRGWATFLFDAAARLFSVKVETTGVEALETEGAYLMYVRHASTLDTLLPFVADGARTFRYVLKEELLVDPCLDVVGNRLRNCFVRRGSDRSEREVQRVVNLGRNLAPTEAVVIFPEGTRFTPEKRARFNARGASELAQQLEHTLSPLRTGAVALGTQSDELDVVIVAHSGIERAATLGDLLFGGLTHARLRIHVWRTPAADVPRDEAAFQAWLGEQWLEVDAFAANGLKHGQR